MSTPAAPTPPAAPAAPAQSAAPAPAAPAAPEAPTGASIFAGMMPGGDTPPPAPDAPPAPAAPADAMGGLRNHLGQFVAKQPDPAPAAPAAPSVVPPAGDPKPAAAPAADVVGDFMKRFYPELPEWIKDEKGISTWKQQRDFMETTLKSVRDMSAKELELQSQLEALKTGKPAEPGTAGPSDETVKKLTLEIESMRKKHSEELAEWETEKARRAISGSARFKQEFEGRMAGLLEEAQGIAGEAQIPEDTLKAIFGATSEYQLAKVLETIKDPTASRLLGEKARAYSDLSKKSTALLNAPDIKAKVDEWKQYEQTMQGVLSARFTDALKAQFAAAMPNVVAELTGKEGDIFFRTQGGQIALSQISNRFANGIDLKPDEVIRALAKAEAATVYQQVASNAMKQIAELQKTLKAYEAADPSRVATPGAPPAPEGGFSIGSMFSGLLGMQPAPAT